LSQAQHDRERQSYAGEEEVLTHRGQKLTDIEQFEDPASDSDDDDGVMGGM
jgi:hypothetical protein